MNGHEARRYSMFERVATFGKAHAADFEPDSEGALRFAAITRILHELGSAAAGQRHGRATVMPKLFDRLRAEARNIARSARAIARHEPGFAELFRVPNSSSHTRLLTAVDAMLVELEWPQVAARFIAHELPVDFVQRLAAHRQALADALAERTASQDDPVFPNSRGGFLSADALQRLVARHVTAASATCSTLAGRSITPHTLRHTTAMTLLQRGVDQAVLALWLGHESAETTQIYLHADMRLKERALQYADSPGTVPARFRPNDSLLAFLESL